MIHFKYHLIVVESDLLESESIKDDKLDNQSTKSKKSSNNQPSKFVSSKWETVDPEKLEKQAVTTSKWDFFDETQNNDESTLNKSGTLTNLTSYGIDEDDDEDSNNNKEDKSENEDDFDDDIDGKPMDDEEEFLSTPVNNNSNTLDEEKRKILREIEVKTVKYIDDLENGKIQLEPNKTIQQQAESYRDDLLKMVFKYVLTN